MTYKKYVYGHYKKEIVCRLRKKLTIDGKLRYHHLKLLQLANQREDIEMELQKYLRMAQHTTNDKEQK